MRVRGVSHGVAATVAGGAALIAAVTVLARLVGFGRQLVFQATVGETLLGGIYATVNALPNMVFEVVAGGALAGVVVPLLAAAALRGDTAYVRQTTSALLGWTLVLLVPVAVLGVVVAGPVTEFMLGGTGGSEGTDVARSMLMVFLPQIPLYGIAVVTAGVMQAHRRFLAAALAPVFSSLVVAGAYLSFAAVFTGDLDDLATLDRRSELILSGGTTLGVLVLALTTFVPMLMRVTGLSATLRFPPGAARRASSLALAGLATLVAQQVAFLTSYVTSNQFGGVGAAVTYQNTWMVYLLPYAVLAVPIATAAFPRLSQQADDDLEAYTGTLAGTTRAVVMVSAVGAAMLVAAAWPIARFFDHIGKGDAPPERMAWGLSAFAFGLLGYGLVAHLGRALFARGRGRAAAAAISAGWLVVVVLAVLGTRAVEPDEVTAALGTANTVGMTVAGFLLLLAVRRDVGPAGLAGLPRVVVFALTGAGLGGLVGWWLATLFPTSGAVAIVTAGVVAAAGAAVVALVVLAVGTRDDLKAVLRR